ncbi:O-antigen/teichoic acid export membrane protein [Microbacteriaceae bacterium SG_E_30_P1]|uniref:O-antigen/teichoic acid export membrane protein n=2 Tax=Antiquaquibacter oligotrophicus TaxID=2880260 RepID=A0ABT6KS17_9MICO|nr:lipopolysaccharide biosynthesis protein [Antiquaquibacter oligotrophicus]MDH6181872.1 O-antigen/teichoic acid export membrane protein [Antiquaquibacter oligotrophicus]UDF12452.1 lipopolysaccharide biosynthesis protein [Antiquaquibacter oligotrophicus]
MSAGEAKKPRKGVAHQFAWVSSGRILAAVLQAFGLVLVARSVSPGDFGVLAAFLGVAAVAQTVIDGGVSTFVIRERAARPGSGDIAVGLRFNNVTSTILGAVTGATVLLLGWLATPTYLLLLPLAVWIGAQRNADNRLSILIADGDAWINVSNLLARRALSVGIIATGIGIGLNPILAFALAEATSCAASAIFANVFIRRRVAPRSSLSFAKLLRSSSPYWVHSMATQARNLDSLLVGLAAGPTQAGFYSSGSRLTNPLRILPNSLSVVLMPEATRAHANSRSMKPFLKLSGIMVLATLVLAVALVVLTPWAVQFGLGKEYVPAIPAVQVTVAALPLWSAISLLQAILQSTGNKRAVAVTSTTFAVIALAGVAIGANQWGATGAAFAVTASLVVQAATLAVRLTATLRRRPNGSATSTPTDTN